MDYYDDGYGGGDYIDDVGGGIVDDYGGDYYDLGGYYDDWNDYNTWDDDRHYAAQYAELDSFENDLRLQQDLSEEDRLGRWQDRVAFEELNESDRLAQWNLMADEDRYRLGLGSSSYWGSRYTGGLSSWRPRYSGMGFSGRGGWGSGRLPLSSGLMGRFSNFWDSARDRQLLRDERRLDRQVAYDDMRYRREEAFDDMRFRREEVRLDRQEDRMYRDDLMRDQLYRDQQLRSDIALDREQLRLDRDLAYGY